MYQRLPFFGAQARARRVRSWAAALAAAALAAWLPQAAADFYVETVAGGGGGMGDGYAAVIAPLNRPQHAVADPQGNLYIADTFGHRIRRVDAATGLITTVAGDGNGSYSGDGGPATLARVRQPTALALDSRGNLYLADMYNCRVRRIDAATGIITTVAGAGTSACGTFGDGGPATEAGVPFPVGLAVAADDDLYIAAGLVIRHVDAQTGIISTVAGNGTPAASGDGGPARDAQLAPWGLAVDGSGNLLVADYDNHRIRRIAGGSPDGTITTVAGNGTPGSAGDGGSATAAQLNSPTGVSVDADGNLYIADTVGNRIRKVAAGGTIQTLAGDGSAGFSGDGGPAAAAQLASPYGLALGAGGNLLIADTGNRRIRRIALATGQIDTLAGNGQLVFSADGVPATEVRLTGSFGLLADAAGNLYLAESGAYRVRRVDAASGLIDTVAGTGSAGYSGDGGPATEAQFRAIAGLALDSHGHLYISDWSNHCIRRVEAGSGTVTTFAGTCETPGLSGDGGPATAATLRYPWGVAVDGADNLYIADRDNHRIRRVDAATGNISTFAGSSEGYAGDGGPAAGAQFRNPHGIHFDTAGNLYIADMWNNAVRRIDGASGVITTVAGDGSSGSSGDGGPATVATLSQPYDALPDAAGNLYITDGNRVRRVDAGGIIDAYAGTGSPGDSGDGGPALTAQFYYMTALAWSGESLYLADGNERIRRVYPRRDQALITATATPGSIAVFGRATLGISGGAGSGAVSYAVTAGSGACSVVDTTLTGTAIGSCTVTATKAEDSHYYAASATVEVSVTGAAQPPLAVTATPGTIAVFESAALGTTGGAGSGAVSYAITAGSDSCTVVNATLTGTAVGSCTVTATKAGDGQYAAATATVDVAVTAAAQAPLAVTASPAIIPWQGSSLLAVSGGSGSGAVSYLVTAGSGNCALAGATLTGTGIGSCTVTATKAGDSRYAAATANVEVTITQAAQSITFEPPAVLGVGERLTLLATASSGLPVTLTGESSRACRLEGATVIGIAAGQCTITATQAGDEHYTAATPVTRSFMVGAAVPLLAPWGLWLLGAGVLGLGLRAAGRRGRQNFPG